MRKYLNDSRYPYDVAIYTKDFYDECLESVLTVQKEIDSANVKKSDTELLSDKFGKSNVSDKRKA